VADRINLSVYRPVEELQARYFFVSNTLEHQRSMNNSSNTKLSLNKFEAEYEKNRRNQLDFLFHRYF
jgi:hypothetical protein